MHFAFNLVMPTCTLYGLLCPSSALLPLPSETAESEDPIAAANVSQPDIIVLNAFHSNHTRILTVGLLGLRDPFPYFFSTHQLLFIHVHVME